MRRLNAAHSAFSDCPDLTVPAGQSALAVASPIVGRWVTAKDYVDRDGTHVFLRIHSEVGPNGNLLARDKQGLGCQGLGLGIVPVTLRGSGEFFRERGLRPLSGSPKFRWDSAKVHCYPRGGRQPKLLTSDHAGAYTYDVSADILWEANGNCYWRKKGGSPKLDLSGARGTFDVRWYDPRHGGPLRRGTVATVRGGSPRSLGAPPEDQDKDWVVLVRPAAAGN